MASAGAGWGPLTQAVALGEPRANPVGGPRAAGSAASSRRAQAPEGGIAVARPTVTEPSRRLHSTEVFEEEIEELENSRPVKSWSSWLAGIGAVSLLVGVVLVVTHYEVKSYRGPRGIGNVAPVQLLQPRGPVDSLPSAFRWDAVDGAASYLVTVSHIDSDEVVLAHAALGTTLAASAEDLSVFQNGKYRWTVDAKGTDGKTKAFGESEFDLHM